MYALIVALWSVGRSSLESAWGKCPNLPEILPEMHFAPNRGRTRNGCLGRAKNTTKWEIEM